MTILKHSSDNFRRRLRPDWSQPREAATLVPMLLAGSWDESSEGDLSAIAKLAGRPYRDVAEVADRWRLAPDPPFVRVWVPSGDSSRTMIPGISLTPR